MLPLVYFVRHGQTDWNAEHRLQGQADIDLNALGRSQAERNGRKLAELIARPAEFDFVASPLSRTRETMELVRAAMGLPPGGYRTDARLIEVHFGDWQGYTFAELDEHEPRHDRRRARSTNGISCRPASAARAMRCCSSASRHGSTSCARPTVCVTHGGVFRVLFRMVGRKPDKEAAALDVAQDRVLRFEDGRLEWL